MTRNRAWVLAPLGALIFALVACDPLPEFSESVNPFHPEALVDATNWTNVTPEDYDEAFSTPLIVPSRLQVGIPRVHDYDLLIEWSMYLNSGEPHPVISAFDFAELDVASPALVPVLDTSWFFNGANGFSNGVRYDLYGVLEFRDTTVSVSIARGDYPGTDDGSVVYSGTVSLIGTVVEDRSVEMGLQILNRVTVNEMYFQDPEVELEDGTP